MCGFVGTAFDDPTRVVDAALLRRMADTLVHRGPDDEGILPLGAFGLGFRRLSIIDLAGGHQPLSNEDETVFCVGNGEIYNFRELRAELIEAGHVFRTGSDIETLVHLYEQVGERCVERLVGMFAFAIVDLRVAARPKLFLGRDRMGIKPMYWQRTAEGLSFGSEAKALLVLERTSREFRGSALVDYLVQGYVGGEEAAWSGIQRLLPGHVLTWSPGEEPRTASYWRVPASGVREPASAVEILEWTDRVVESRMIADVPLGAFLSGGVDSTAVATSMAAASADPIVACSVGFADARFDELDTARETAKRLGAIHHTAILDPDPTIALEILPWLYDEPLADPSTVPTYLVSRMAREHVKVALAGDGGDEVFAGYRRYVFDEAENRVRARLGAPGRTAARLLGSVYPKLDWAPRFLRAQSTLRNLGRDPAAAYWASVCPSTREEIDGLLAPELRAALRGHDPLDRFRDHYDRPTDVEPLFRAQYADFHGFLPDRILCKTDRASMGVGLEVRVPLLDHRFVERFLTLPSREKVRAGRGKHAFREALRERVPASVLDGRKMGFDVPLRDWLRGPLAEPVRDAVETLPGDWFDRGALRTLFAEHASGHRDRSDLLWALLVLEHWRRRHHVRGIAA